MNGPEMIRADVAFAIETIAKYPDGVDYIPRPVDLPDHFGTRAPRPLVWRGSTLWRRWSGQGFQAQNLPRYGGKLVENLHQSLAAEHYMKGAEGEP